jgi:hypothetical protein
MRHTSSGLSRDGVGIRFPIKVDEELVGIPVIIITVHEGHLCVNVLAEM